MGIVVERAHRKAVEPRDSDASAQYDGGPEPNAPGSGPAVPTNSHRPCGSQTAGTAVNGPRAVRRRVAHAPTRGSSTSATRLRARPAFGVTRCRSHDGATPLGTVLLWPRRRRYGSFGAACVCVLVVALGGCAVRRGGRPFEAPAETARTVWHGYERFDFALDGRHCIVVRPKNVAPGTPWVWRATFFDERPDVEIGLLARGFHVVYMEVTDLCGSPTAVARWDAFYRYLTQSQGFAERPALTTISRGGLITYNWAVAHPDRVACIYADIPVCDFKSWPGGKGSGPGDAGEWQRCLQVYGFNEAQALSYTGNPVDNLAPLANAGVPLLHAVGDADRLVPFDENTGLVMARYRALGGDIDVIVKHGLGHASGVDDATPVIEFIAAHAK